MVDVIAVRNDRSKQAFNEMKSKKSPSTSMHEHPSIF